jgi:hypothetical protein
VWALLDLRVARVLWAGLSKPEAHSSKPGEPEAHGSRLSQSEGCHSALTASGPDASATVPNFRRQDSQFVATLGGSLAATVGKLQQLSGSLPVARVCSSPSWFLCSPSPSAVSASPTSHFSTPAVLRGPLLAAFWDSSFLPAATGCAWDWKPQLFVHSSTASSVHLPMIQTTGKQRETFIGA